MLTDRYGRDVDLADAEPLGSVEEKPGVGPDGKPGGHAAPGVYSADGDPYLYRLNQDGTVTIVDGPTGKGHTLNKGVAYDAIIGQVLSGQLVKMPDERGSGSDKTAFQPSSGSAAGSQLGRSDKEAFQPSSGSAAGSQLGRSLRDNVMDTLDKRGIKDA